MSLPSGRSVARRRRLIGALAVSAVAAAGVAVTIALAGTALAAATGGVGATLPYVEVQAENSATSGSVIGPSAAYGTLPAEASYRKAVTLQGTGKYVEFSTPVATNSMVFRYSIPDTSNGSVYTAPLSLYVNGAKQTNFTLTNAYSWYYGGYPFTNSPGSNPHHFYDEAHRLFAATYPAGTKFRLQVDAEDTASSYTIDFADFENVGAAIAQPAGSVSITSYGADPTGSADSTAAFNSAISAAGAGGTVWVPAGTFRVPGHIIVNNVSIRGAGMWRSTVTGAAPGFYGNNAPTGSSGVHLADFAIFGDVQERNDGAQVNGIGGALNNSTVDRLWIEHEKVGAWMDGPFTGLVFSGMRIRNTTADGVNFHGGVTNSKVTNSDLRNLGDDGLATWADQAIGADANDSFDHNTVQYPILANGIAIYGGHDNFVTDNRVIDAGLTQGGGIHVAQRFASTTLGRTDVLRNTLIRDGSLDPNWNFGVGALWFDARDAAMSGLTNVDNILIQQSPFEAIQFVSGSSITNVKINNATIQNTGTWVVQEQVGGAATISNSTATGTQASAPVYNCGVGFTLTNGGGNSGVTSPTACQNIANPAFPPYLPDSGPTPSTTPKSPSPSASPSPTAPGTTNIALHRRATASSQVNGSLTPAQATDGDANTYWESANNAFPQWLQADLGSAQSVGGIVLRLPASWGARNQTLSVLGSTDGTNFTTVVGSATYAFNPAATISFPPTTQRYLRLNLTANTGWPAGQVSEFEVYPSGGGTTPTNLAAGRPTAESSHTQGYVSANATDADQNTYWESANNAFPQWIQVDLGSAKGASRIVLQLPASWGTRNQTLSVLGSTDGSSFTTVVGSASYTFDPAANNTVTIRFSATTQRYFRLNFTANTSWPAGQLSTFQVWNG